MFLESQRKSWNDVHDNAVRFHSVICNAKDLSPAQKAAIETPLGRVEDGESGQRPHLLSLPLFPLSESWKSQQTWGSI